MVHKKTPCARKLQKLVKGDKSHSKRLPTPLSFWTKTFLLSSNFSPRKSVFRVRLAGNKTKQELKTGNSSLLCSHNRDKFEYINGRSVSQSWVSSVFSDKNEKETSRESVDTNSVEDRTMLLGFDKEPNLFVVYNCKYNLHWYSTANRKSREYHLPENLEKTILWLFNLSMWSGNGFIKILLR